ncbi:MAG: SGNH/GDSL hydrolase family protein [Alphaproteobacteria bacterium]|nr:SGNH/GDSL hydrolase family protein [Alphaproteobacteria bacterium]
MPTRPRAVALTLPERYATTLSAAAFAHMLDRMIGRDDTLAHPRWRRWLGAFALVGLLGLALGLGTVRAEPRCAAPHELLEDDGDLPLTAAAIGRKQPIRIVAIGGASTAGMGASGAGAAYPARLQTHLASRLASHTVSVVNKSVARQTAAEMAARFPADVLAEKPTLVLWETGAADAVRGIEVDDFSRTLNDGIARLKAAGADVILVEPQYAPRTMTLMNLPPYLEAVSMVADGAGVVMFRRFEIMRHWTEQGRFDMSVKPPALTAEIDALYDCLGQLIAQLITERLIADGVTGLR